MEVKTTSPYRIYVGVEDDIYGLVRSPNFHDLEYCSRRRHCLFIDSCNGNDDDDCLYLDDPNAAVIRLRPILPSPYRDFSYKSRTGWNYCPSSRNAPMLDRLGTGAAQYMYSGYKEGRQRQKRLLIRRHATKVGGNNDKACTLAIASILPMPSTKMIVPASWTSNLSEGIIGLYNSDEKLNTNESKDNRTSPKGEYDPKSGKRKHGATSFTSTTEEGLKLDKKRRLHGCNSIITTFSNCNETVTTESNTTCSTNYPNDNEKSDRLAHTIKSAIDVTKTTVVNHMECLPHSSQAKVMATPSTTAVTTILNTTTNFSRQGKEKSYQDVVVKTSFGFPKEALYQWYGKKPRKTQVKAHCYITWDNGRMNEQLFSAIFVCPLTNEAFLAGPWYGAGQAKSPTDGPRLSTTVEPDQDGLCWYPRKIMAEHAAAARAWDCLVMREPGGIDGSINCFGGLKPYWPSQRPKWPVERIPAWVLERLPLQQNENIGLFEKGDGDKILSTQKTALFQIDTAASIQSDESKKAQRKQIGAIESDRKHMKNDVIKRERTLSGGDQWRNSRRRYRDTQGYPRRKYNYNCYNHSIQTSRTQELLQYRAQRMTHAERCHQSQHHMKHQLPQEQRPNPEIDISHQHNKELRTSREQQQLDTTVFQNSQYQLPRWVQHHIPHQNNSSPSLLLQQNQYLQTQSNENHFQFSGKFQSLNNLQVNQQRYPLPPPPPPPPLESTNNHPTRWNN